LVTHLAARPVVLRAGFRAAEMIDTVRHEGVTFASMAPTMISSLLAHLEEHPDDRPGLASLRAVAYGSSAIGAALLRRTLDQLGLDLYQGYGMTEASGNMAFLGPDEHRRAVDDAPWLQKACGRPSAAVEMAVVDDAGSHLPAGAPGEIVVRGEQMTPGYFCDPEATRAASRDGWFRTGDIGRFDEDGYLYVIDRAKDIVVSGGENISARQVEEALASVPGVVAASVVGVPDDHWGEAVCACIEVIEGADAAPESVRQAVRPHLPRFAVPKHVLISTGLPRNPNGKVQKPALRAWAMEQLGVEGA
jgi:acyl-CoA synthetase (AMP-forming)/AMP-acid ligase II